MTTFDVEIEEGKIITNQLVCEIYAIRHVPTLRIIVNINNEIKKLPYIEFTKLANVRKEILKLEQWETNKDSVKKSDSVDIEDNVDNIKMDFNIKEAKSIIGVFDGNKSEVLDYIEVVTYYNESLKVSERAKLSEFILRVSLKGRGKEAVQIM